jgi:hypothetical protein
MMPKLFEYQYEQIISDYLSGMTQKAVALKNGVCRGAVGEIVKARGINTRSYTGERTFTSNRKWIWDYSFFEKRNPTVAYWAGFMMADGSLNTNGRASTLIFVLQEKDREHVFKFCKDISVSTDAIYERKDKSVGINLSYSHFTEQLKPWGIVHRKTYNFIEPEVNTEFLPHYLRGWVDGDGSVYSFGDGARFTVSGNTQSLQWFEEKLKELGYDGSIRIKSIPASTVSSLLYIGGQNQVNVIRKLLLVDESFKLERRWNVYYKTKHITFTHYCKFCGKPFEVTRHRHEQEPQNGKFCNKICYDNNQRGQVRKVPQELL